MKSKVVSSILVLLMVAQICGCGANNNEILSQKDIYVENETVVEKNEVEKEEEIIQVTEVAPEITEEIEDEKVATSEKNSTLELNALDGKVTKEDFRVIINNVEVLFGTDINTILPALGEPDSFSSARSCMDDGEEKTYTFGGYTIITYPDGDKDIIDLMEFYDDAVTDANIGVGSTREEVEKAYGTVYEVMGDNIIYEISIEKAITIQYEKDKVVWLDMYYREY